jgi:ribosomal protein S18 acetylase RimI-like enzyme
MAHFAISTASAGEMPKFAEWAGDEQWNPGQSDVLAFHPADPGGFFLGRLDGEPVASVSRVRYGTDIGFLGFYIARPAVRGQGYGIRLWQAAMAHLAGRNVGLDGMVEQQENYRGSGFRRAWTHVRYAGVPSGERAPDGIELVDGRSRRLPGRRGVRPAVRAGPAPPRTVRPAAETGRDRRAAEPAGGDGVNPQHQKETA